MADQLTKADESADVHVTWRSRLTVRQRAIGVFGTMAVAIPAIAYVANIYLPGIVTHPRFWLAMLVPIAAMFFASWLEGRDDD